MNVVGSASIPVSAGVGTLAGHAPADEPGPPVQSAARQAGPPVSAEAEDPFDRVARLAAMLLGTPQAFVTIAGEQQPSGQSRLGAAGAAGPQT
jgi:hypothetical protein